MADGIFTVRPKRLTAITCSLGEDHTNNYQVIPTRVNWNEGARKQIAYAQAKLGGSVRAKAHGLAEASFEIVVFGSDPETAMSNLNSLMLALSEPGGGYIQYRPRGLDSSVMSTYYHYLESPPPSIMGQGVLSDIASAYAQADRSGTEYAIRCRFVVRIKSWATSDPTTLVTIKSATSIDNYDDDSHDNYVDIENSDIKGDAVKPVIYYERTDSESGYIRYMYTHHRRMYVGDTDNADWQDSINWSYGAPWSNVVHSPACGGSYLTAYTGGASEIIQYTGLPTSDMSRLYFNKVTPMILAKTNGQYTVEFKISQTQQAYQANSVTVDSQYWKLYSFGQYDFPLFPVPERIPRSLVDSFVYSLYLTLTATMVSSGNLDFDFSWTPNVREVLLYSHASNSSAYISKNDFVCIDSIEGIVSKMSGISPEYGTCPLDSGGDAPLDLILRKNYGHRIRFLCLDDNALFRYLFTGDVTVKGLYLTIFPFSES